MIDPDRVRVRLGVAKGRPQPPFDFPAELQRPHAAEDIPTRASPLAHKDRTDRTDM